jgi:hypothetical protein
MLVVLRGKMNKEEAEKLIFVRKKLFELQCQIDSMLKTQ